MNHLRQFTLLVVVLGGLLALVGGLATAQAQTKVQELAVIHSLTVDASATLKAPTLFPSELRVKVGQPVRLFNVTADPNGVIHDPVVISSDEDGKNPVFGIQGFRVEPGKVTVIEFTPGRTGIFFITHRQHFHDVVGKLIVEE